MFFEVGKCNNQTINKYQQQNLNQQQQKNCCWFQDTTAYNMEG